MTLVDAIADAKAWTKGQKEHPDKWFAYWLLPAYSVTESTNLCFQIRTDSHHASLNSHLKSKAYNTFNF